MTPHEVLKKYWGYEDFRAMQLDIIQSVLDGNDTLALLPTGGGKSLCFQVPALCLGGICVVVSPLIALMKDQVQNLKKHGIRAYAIYSGMKIQDIDRILDNCINGSADFLYLSPERLTSEIARERIRQMNVTVLAVDEAHCISQWGYDFRPSYLNIAEIRELLPKTPLIALTATATTEVVEDIQVKLEFKENRKVFKKSFMRDNLAYVVLHEQNKEAKLLEILKKIDGSGIVYVMNRRQTKEIAIYLRNNKISAEYYHAGLNSESRSEIQDRWVNDKTRIIVATNAFGMGIDKPEVRIVVHMTLPDSLEAYFQEAGRGGRDGEKAFAVLLYNLSDRYRLEQQYEQSFPPLKEVRQIYRALGSYFQLAIGAGWGRSFDFDLGEFCKRYNLAPIKTLHALKILMRNEYLELSDNVFFPSTLRVAVGKEVLYDYMLRNSRMELLIKTILRSYQGAFNHLVNIKENQLARFLKMSNKALVAALYKLNKDKIIDYRPKKDVPQLTFLTERLDAGNLVIDQELFKFLKNRHQLRMQASLAYSERLQCRSQTLLAYFDEADSAPCGKCDFCLNRHKRMAGSEEFTDIAGKIEAELSQQPLSLRGIVQRFPGNMENRVLDTINQMLDNGFLQFDSKRQLQWKK